MTLGLALERGLGPPDFAKASSGEPGIMPAMARRANPWEEIQCCTRTCDFGPALFN